MCRRDDQIVGGVGEFAGEWTCDFECYRTGRLGAQPIAVRAEGEHRLDVMPSVRALAAHVQREVELCRRNLARRGQGAELAEVRPLLSLAFTRAAMSSSAVTSAAFHANLAS